MTQTASWSVTCKSWGFPEVQTQRNGPKPREKISLKTQWLWGEYKLLFPGLWRRLTVKWHWQELKIQRRRVTEWQWILKLKWCGWKWSWSNLRLCSEIYLLGLRKTSKTWVCWPTVESGHFECKLRSVIFYANLLGNALYSGSCVSIFRLCLMLAVLHLRHENGGSRFLEAVVPLNQFTKRHLPEDFNNSHVEKL